MSTDKKHISSGPLLGNSNKRLVFKMMDGAVLPEHLSQRVVDEVVKPEIDAQIATVGVFTNPIGMYIDRSNQQIHFRYINYNGTIGLDSNDLPVQNIVKYLKTGGAIQLPQSDPDSDDWGEEWYDSTEYSKQGTFYTYMKLVAMWHSNTTLGDCEFLQLFTMYDDGRRGLQITIKVPSATPDIAYCDEPLSFNYQIT